MKITLAGTPGSGKSTLRSLLAKHYNLEARGTGDFMRKISKQHGYNDITKFLIEYVSKHPEVDYQIDEEQRLLESKMRTLFWMRIWDFTLCRTQSGSV